MKRNGLLLILAASLAGCGHAAAVVPPEVTFNNIQWDRLTDDNSLTHGKLDVVITRLAELQSAFEARVPAPEPTPVEPEPEPVPVAEVEPQLPESPTAPAAPPGVFLPVPPAVESVAVADVVMPSEAVLFSANFTCPPCDRFQAELHKLPFPVRVIHTDDTPSHSFPYIAYANPESPTGWGSFHGGTVDEFLAYLKDGTQPVRKVDTSRMATIDGRLENVDVLISQYYRGTWRHDDPSILNHLLEHGVASEDIARFDSGTLERLHSALHEREQGMQPMSRRVVSQPARVQTQPVYYASGCPGGNCPTGLFVRRWR